MKAQLRYDLFQTNEKHDETFGKQLENGTRALFFGGTELVYDVECGFTYDDDTEMITLDWDYTVCTGLIPTIAQNAAGTLDELVYSIALTSPGNHPNIPVIEFYVDTKVTAECRYPAKIELDASFWVNQEDVFADSNQTGKFLDLFKCEFFNDAAREDSSKINEHNIVNMGRPIYGKASAIVNMPHLKYTLTGVTVTDASGKTAAATGTASSYQVIGPNWSGTDNLSPEVNAAWDDNNLGTSAVQSAQDILFSYLSFGFENLSHQNDLDITCHVEVGMADKIAQIRFFVDEYEIGEWYTQETTEGAATHSFTLGDTPIVTLTSGGDETVVHEPEKLKSGGDTRSKWFDFNDGDSLFFDHAGSQDGVGLKKMELWICDKGEFNCESRAVRLNGQEAYWFQDIEEWANSFPGKGYWGCAQSTRDFPLGNQGYIGPAVEKNMDIPGIECSGGQDCTHVESGAKEFTVQCGNYPYAVEAELFSWTGITSTMCAQKASFTLNYENFLNDQVDLYRNAPCPFENPEQTFVDVSSNVSEFAAQDDLTQQ